MEKLFPTGKQVIYFQLCANKASFEHALSLLYLATKKIDFKLKLGRVHACSKLASFAYDQGYINCLPSYRNIFFHIKFN